MATGHATSGLLVGTATAGVTGAVFGAPAWWAWAAVVAGCSLLPDVDMRRTVADGLWGPFTAGVRIGRIPILPGLWSLIRPLLGGHRARSHRIEGVIVFLAVVGLATFWSWSSALVAALAVGLAIRAAALVAEWLVGFRYRRSYWLFNAAASWAVGWWVIDTGTSLPGWLPWAMALGCAAHIGGDLCTDGGVKLTYMSEKKAGLPNWLAFKAGGWFEHAAVMPVLVIATSLVVAYSAGYHPLERLWEALA